METMRKRLTMASAAYSESRQSELDDLKFSAASPDNQWQWPQDVINSRASPAGGAGTAARPVLTINKLPQHIRQITNDMRQNRPAGKVIPVDDKADVKVAEIYDGMVRHIEYISDADVADDTACENQVTFGEGFFRILTEYCDDESFDQDIRIARIRNSFSVYMDQTIQDPCGSDAEWCFICEDILNEEYERLYPDAMPISTLKDNGVGDESMGSWLSEDTIRIAEYFYVVHERATLNLYANGMTLLSTDPQAKEVAAAGIKPTKTRNVDVRKVKWMKTNGYEALEEKDWAGKWIPVIRVVGNEFQIEGRMYVSGIVRNAKDAQRMYNYWTSQEAEMLALAPKAPFIGYGGQFEGYENQWKTANTQNWPYLEVNPDVMDQQGHPMPLPQRAQPPMLSAGILQAKMGASEDIKSTTGQYDASIGAEANEKSGKAILAREKQTDTGTYHYVDNYARAVRYRTRQIVDLIPKVYDTRRIARIIGLDGETDHIEVDPEQQEPMHEVRDQNGAVIKRVYNPSIGKYDVCVTTGPSYMTKRKENAEMMVDLAQGAADPTVALVMRYFAVKNMDFPDAQEFAKVLKKMVPNGLLDNDDDTSPEMAAAKKQIDGMGQQMQQMQAMMHEMANSVQVTEQQREDFLAEVQAYKAETERLKAMQPAIDPVQIQLLVQQTIQQMMAEPPLEMVEEQPPPMPPDMAPAEMPPEMMFSEPPLEGGFSLPEGM